MSTTETKPQADPTDFTESDDCKSFRFCSTCRDTGTAGKLWRRVVAKRYNVPSVDWPCPHGWKWGGKPGLVLQIKQKLGIGTRIGRTTSAFGIQPCGGCARRAARLDGREA